MNKEQKKSYALLILTSLEKLVEQNYIKQDIITIGGEMFTDRGGGLTHVVEFATIPYIDKKPQEKIRTIYIYSTLKTLRLPLNMGYWNISLIPLSQKIQGDNIIYHQGVTLKSIQRVTLENKHSAKHIILENITIINRLKELKLYINSNLYEIVKTKILKNPHFTAKDILQDIKNSIQQMKIPVYQPKTKKDSLAADIDKRV